MSVSTTGELDFLVQKATSESIPNGELDLPSAMEISDVVRSRRVSPKDCMRCLKRRIMSTTSNPNTQLSSWKLTDICVKNGGIPFIKEICSREFMDTMEHTILKNRQNVDLQELVTRLFCELYLAFKNDSQLNYVSKVYDRLVARGVEFPQSLMETSSSMAMFDSRTPADWVDSDACMICSKRFSLINRRHHCRSCGGIFCQDHSSHRIVLSDLGIYEPVRVCDNCYEDYDLKKGSGTDGGKKKHHRRKKKSADDDFDDEEQLRKAIELSLRESKGSIEPIVPVMHKAEPKVEPRKIAEEDDPDLKAAIEASLREAEEEKRRNEAHAASQQQQRNSLPEPQRQPVMPSFELTLSEEEDIHLFASLVERMKSQSATEILEDAQLPKLYQKVIGTRPKLNNALNDSIQKYNTLIDMNTKISDIMTIYDGLLERQLNDITMSDRYSVPQVPSDPYSYNRREQTAYQRNGALPNQPIPAQQSLPPQQMLEHQQHNQHQQYQEHQQYQKHQQYQEQQQYQQYQQHQQHQQHQQPEPHLSQMRDLNLSPSDHASAFNLPSEPPYPLAEDEEINPEDNQHSTHKEATTDDVPVERKHPDAERKLSNGAPYPVDDVESESAPQPENTSHSNNAITNFDFPAVPARKIAQATSAPAMTEPNVPEAMQSEEKLLIEL